jgi:hypothetical protein
MRAATYLAAVVLAMPLHYAFPQRRVVTDARLPADSIELKRNDPPATSTPWQLPKPGDPLYDAKKEAEIRKNKQSHLVHVFERGVFKGYATLTSAPPPEKLPKEMHSWFTPNPQLPADAVELSSSENPDKSGCIAARPKTRPANVPASYILVRVFHRGKLIGWSYLPKDAVAALHKSKKI